MPSSYSQSEDTYDVIYASDGQWSFDEYSGIIRDRNLDIILVNIHQGPEGRRNVDYPLPDARDFFNVIVDELIPFIEQQYRIDTSNRTFVGASYGGMLVSNLLLLDDGDNLVFKNLVSMDAPFLVTHRQATTDLLDDRYNLSTSMEVNLMLTSALVPASIGGFDANVSAFHLQLEEKGFQGLNISRYAYSVDHFNITGPSFNQAILEYFGE